MLLYLVRHGDALDPSRDPQRSLNRMGQDDARRIGEALGRIGVRVDMISCSTKLRAKQTAQIIAKHVSTSEPIEVPGLAPNDPVEPVIQRIEESDIDEMLVGHLPFMEIIASRLLTGNVNPQAVQFQSASACCLERTGDGFWTLHWLIRPALLP